uniref:Acyltransferase 3 domain-containing protein n=1 Tax=Alexandrium catenella TaxID=2925 RepID=A0A7S1PPR4_ALECA
MQPVRASLEVCLCCLQPALFFVACLQLCPTDEESRRSGNKVWGASWCGWAVERMGKAALGCYVFHYFLTPTFAGVVVRVDTAIASWGLPHTASGVLQLLWTMFVPAAFLFVLGPAFQFALTAPFLYLAGAGHK